VRCQTNLRGWPYNIKRHLLGNTCIIFLLLELKIGTSENVKYKRNDTKMILGGKPSQCEKWKTTGPLSLLNFHYNDNRNTTISPLGGSHDIYLSICKKHSHKPAHYFSHKETIYENHFFLLSKTLFLLLLLLFFSCGVLWMLVHGPIYRRSKPKLP